MTSLLELRSIPAGAGSETLRILRLPWRTNDVSALADQVSRLFLLPHGSGRLFPVQAQALAELAMARGGIVMAGVGAGKTLTSLLAPTALEVERAVLLVPASLVDKTRHAIDDARQNWRLIPDLAVWSYETLSSAKALAALSHARPALVVADECHALRNMTAARTRRVAAFLRDSGAMFVGLTGTLMRRGVCDFAHLTAWALREQSPVPRPTFPQELDAWDRLISPDVPAHRRPSLGGFRQLMVRDDCHIPAATVRRRLTGTVGVVATSDVCVTTPLQFHEAPISASSDILDAIKRTEATWTTPTGDAIADAAQMTAVTSQLSDGFVYRWEWPDGVVNKEWLSARYNWRRLCADVIAHADGACDSEMTTANMLEAAEHTRTLTPLRAKALDALRAWREIRPTCSPVTVPVWLSDHVVAQSVDWLTSSPAGSVVWFRHKAVGDAMAARGVKVFTAGTDSSVMEWFKSSTAMNCALSISAHGTGKNLQAAWNALVLDPPSSGTTWEQLVGRHHRHGQRHDVVHIWAAQHTKQTRDAVQRARADALAIEQTTGNAQRLNSWNA